MESIVKEKKIGWKRCTVIRAALSKLENKLIYKFVADSRDKDLN